MDVFTGAALGTAFGVLYDLLKVALNKNTEFKTLLRALKSTLDSLEPLIIQDIGAENVALGLRNDVIQTLETQMQEGEILLEELLHVGRVRIQWNYCMNPCYGDRLVELDDSLKMLVKSLELQQARDVKATLRLARSIRRDTAALRRPPSPSPPPPPPRPPPNQLFPVETNTIEMIPRQLLVSVTLQLPQPAPPRLVFVERYTTETISRQVVSVMNTETMPQRERNGVVKAMTEGVAAVGEILDVIMEARNKTMMAKSLVGDLKSTTSWISEKCKGRKKQGGES